ncbi:MAG: nagA [Actinomycetia bacterium]|nr:nagA [Actinomycetes bacterium]
MTVFAAARVLCGDIPNDEPAWVEVDDHRIVATGVGPRAGAVDLGDRFLAPGYLDIQVNGMGATDFATATTEECVALFGDMVRGGVTGSCPTVCTAPLDAYAPMLERLSATAVEVGPRMLGVHLEGPFLGDAPGAHPVDLIRPVDLDWLRALLDRFPGLVRIVTLAPEADPGFEATKLLVARGVTVALGHSRASYEDARAAADAGATLVTHLFNGMGPLHHRAPGLPGAALTDHRLTPSLIADCVHVDPAMVRLATVARPDLVLVTDAVATDADGIRFDGDAAYLSDGTLAGSGLTMERAVRNVVMLGVPVAVAVTMATTNPARVLGLTDRGRIVPGARADLITVRSTDSSAEPVNVAA